MNTARKTLAGLILLLAPHAVAGEPPPQQRKLPGASKGSLASRWLAPYVSATLERVGSGWSARVRWFDAEGRVRKELAGRALGTQPGFVHTQVSGEMVVHAVNGDWKFVLPRKGIPDDAYVTSTVDSRVFVHEWHPDRERIGVDVYVDGKLAGTIGPYLQYRRGNVQLGATGSLGLLTWKTQARKVPQLVVADSGGRVHCRVDCGSGVHGPIPAPDGAAALVQREGGSFEFWRAEGRVAAFDIEPNAHFVRWMPGDHHALFLTSLGEANRYRVVDCTTGKIVWDVPHPGGGHTTLECIAVEGDFVLLSGLDSVKVGTRNGPVRTVYALRATTGKLHARWRPWPFSPHFSIDAGRLVKLGKRLFVVADDEFAELDPSDITARKNGWR